MNTIKIFENVMLPYADENMPSIWTLQQDSDANHTSKKWQKRISNHHKVALVLSITWPKLKWKLMETECSCPTKQNQAELWKVIKREWAFIPIEKGQKLIYVKLQNTS